jgi:hypothetical protein
MGKNYAYLEKIGGEWLDDFVYISKEPLKRLGFEIRAFDGDDWENTLTCYPLDIKTDIIIGSVQSTTIFYTACGIETPKYLGYPEELKLYLNRELRDGKFGNLFQGYPNFPYFIKPKNDVKLFTGEVITEIGQLQWIKEYTDITDDTEVYISAVLPKIVSEYRCFVHEDKLVGIQYYLGDFKIFPSVHVIEDMIASYKSSNCAYTLDVGVMEHGSTVLIEVNDMWAIGSYGMDAKTYALMCVRRMREIGRQANGETESLWKKLAK